MNTFIPTMVNIHAQEVEDHPNAVKLLEVYESADNYYVVMECCDGGELFEHISKEKASVTRTMLPCPTQPPPYSNLDSAPAIALHSESHAPSSRH